MSEARNPVEPFLRMDRMPHIWVSGLRHRHHRQLLRPRPDRVQGRSAAGPQSTGLGIAEWSLSSRPGT